MDSKLIFIEGVMGSAKTVDLLIKGYSLQENGKKVLYIKPKLDVRSDKIESRTGLYHDCFLITPNKTIVEQISLIGVDYIMVDESQFLTKKQIDELSSIVYNNDITIYCYGLLTDFKQELFEGSQRLIEVSDEIRHIKKKCSCGNTASVNSRYDETGSIITEGEKICVGGNEKYQSICTRCYNRLLSE